MRPAPPDPSINPHHTINPPLPNTNTVEVLLFAFAFAVLSISLVMFLRLYKALSPPTKTMMWVIAANVVLAGLYLLFSGIKLYYLTRGTLVPLGEPTCHYLHPLARSCQLLSWLGQPIMAWVTYKTIRNQPVPSGRLKVLTGGAVGVAVVFLVLSEVYMPGNVIWGCVRTPHLMWSVSAGL